VKVEEKIAGGKLLCVEIRVGGGEVAQARISGDFFLHPEEAIERLESALSGMSVPIKEPEARMLLDKALGDAQLIGASTSDIARLAAVAGR